MALSKADKLHRKFESYVFKAQKCRTRKLIVSCALCKMEKTCTIQIEADKVLEKYRNEIK